MRKTNRYVLRTQSVASRQRDCLKEWSRLVLVILLASVMILSYSHCGKKGGGSNKTSGTSTGSSALPALAFVQEPTTTVAGANILPAVTVIVRDTSGSIISNTAVSVTTTTQLNGTTTQMTDGSGIATFNDLNITTTGTYLLAARAGALGPINSTNFDITVATPNTLTFVQQPTITMAGSNISPAVTVQVVDQYNNLVPSAAVSVTTTTQLNGTTTQTTDAIGVASFNDLSITTTGTYTLTARAATATPTNSISFNITVDPPNTLAFVQQPTTATAGANIVPAVTIQITDQYDNLVPNAAVSVTTTTQLNGTTTTTTNTSGIATFNDLSITTTGTYLLAARAGALGPINSNAFSITIPGSWTETVFTTGAFANTTTTTNSASVQLGLGVPVTPSVWSTMTDTPASVLGGGSLASTGDDFIYGFRGNATNNFWRYSISGNSWTTMTGSPFPVSNGGALVYPGSGDFIYGLRGGGNPNFWRYSISGDSWLAMTDTLTSIADGGSLVYSKIDGYIYAFRGGNTKTFWRYSISGNSWLPMTDATANVYGGGSLVCPETDGYIYAFNGYNTKTFWRYSISGNSWLPMTDAPANVDPGCSMVYPGTGDFIYALGGNTTSNFFRYSISGNSWTTMTDAPATVNWGGALVYPGSGNFTYAFRGNNTTNFWRCRVIDYFSSGAYTSTAIPPSGTITQWGVLTFTSNAPGSTTFTVDVLNEAGDTVLLTNVASGGSLSSINAVTNPKIRLRANFATSDTAVTPTLSDWSVTYTYIP